MLVVFLLATGCQEQASDAGGVPSIRKIRLGYPALSATVFPLVYAQEKGIFEQEGVEVEMTRIRGVARIVATLISGDLDVGWMGFDGITNAVSQGAEERGFRILQYQGNLMEPWGGEGLVTHTRVISSKGEALKGLVTGMIRAVEEMQEKRAEAVELAAAYLVLDPAMAEKVYDHMMPIFKVDGKWNLEGIQRTLDEKTGPERKMDVTQFVDDAFLER